MAPIWIASVHSRGFEDDFPQRVVQGISSHRETLATFLHWPRPKDVLFWVLGNYEQSEVRGSSADIHNHCQPPHGLVSTKVTRPGRQRFRHT